MITGGVGKLGNKGVAVPCFFRNDHDTNLVQNRILTAKTQRTRGSYFLFGGERPPNKKPSVPSGR